MPGPIANLALAAMTALIGALLVSAFSLGLASTQSPGRLVVVVAALALLGPILVEPFRLFAARAGE